MIIPKQPSIEQNQHPRDLIAHIKPVDEDLVSETKQVIEVVENNEPDESSKEEPEE